MSGGGLLSLAVLQMREGSWVGVGNKKNESVPITDGRRVNTSKTLISQLGKAGAQQL
jgi:hypothetical protein